MRLLHIIATPRGHVSNTLRVSNALLEELYLKYTDLSVDVLDLFISDLPAVAGENIENKYKLMTGQQIEGPHKKSWEQIETNIQRFIDADIYLISTPMWNFGIPYALKYYIDAIVQPGYLFRYDELGNPEGLVRGKTMICVTSRGGDYSENSPLRALDFVEPYLRTIFNFVGITDIHFINAQPTDISLPLRRTAILNAIEVARQLARNINAVDHKIFDTVQFPDGVKPAIISE